MGGHDRVHFFYFLQKNTNSIKNVGKGKAVTLSVSNIKYSCGRRNRDDDYNFGGLQILGPLFFSHIRESSLLVLDVAKPVFLKLSILVVQVGGYSKAICPRD